MITASDVNKPLLKNVFPIIAGLGFKKVTPRYFRRLRGQTIERILIQSFTRDSAASLDVSTVSFTVSFSVYFLDECKLPWGTTVDPSGKDERTYHHASAYLAKTLAQLAVPNPKIWYVDGLGENLPEVLSDLSQQLVKHAPEWFDKFIDAQQAIRLFSDVPDTYLNEHGIIESLGGKLYSIHRAKVITALAMAENNVLAAFDYWQQCRQSYLEHKREYALAEIDSYIAQLNAFWGRQPPANPLA